MLEFHSKSSESHKATFISIIKKRGPLSAIFTLAIYKTDRLAGEQVVSIFGLELAGPKLENLKLTTPEAHAAYQVFLTGTSEDLELFLDSKLTEGADHWPSDLAPRISSSESQSQEKSK